MDKKKEEDSFSTAKTNSSSINNNPSKNEDDDEDFFSSRARGGNNKYKANNNCQPGRATISVPLSSFNGISHSASFQSKLLFFNGGKPRPKFKHIPFANEKVPEDSKKKPVINKIEKKVEKKNENDNDDIKLNINSINKLYELESKNTNNGNKNNNNNSNIIKNNNNNNNNNNSNNNNNIKNIVKNKISTDIKKEKPEDKNCDTKINMNKKHPVNIQTSKTLSVSLNYDIPGFSKIQKEEKKQIKKPNQKITKEIKNLKSLKDQWSFQKILLDYNILDFTSKFKFFYF